ncbi:hypothetical protein RYX36_033855 [Vicia faba]
MNRLYLLQGISSLSIVHLLNIYLSEYSGVVDLVLLYLPMSIFITRDTSSAVAFLYVFMYLLVVFSVEADGVSNLELSLWIDLHHRFQSVSASASLFPADSEYGGSVYRQ